MNPEKYEQIRHDALMDEYRSSVKEGIREWFLRHYEDPAESTPYDSSEGGYLYQWGGPYDARDVLHERFGGEVEDELIDEVAEELESISSEWERIPTLEDIRAQRGQTLNFVVRREIPSGRAVKRQSIHVVSIANFGPCELTFGDPAYVDRDA